MYFKMGASFLMSVEENLDFGNRRSAENKSSKEEIIELLGLEKLLKKTIDIIWRTSTLLLGELSCLVQGFCSWMNR